MKWLFVLLLALAIFGGAAWFGYNTFVKEEIEVKKEQRGEVTPPPAVDVSVPDFEAAVKVREDGKLTEARDALVAFIQKYPNGKHLDEARDILGEVNTAILLSRHPSPEKIEYIVKPGDVLAKIARKLKTTPEMIMRMNNMSGTMLRIGDRLLISHPDFSMVVQRKANLIVVLNHGAFPEALPQVLSPPSRDRRRALWNDSLNPAAAVPIQRSAFQNRGVAIPWLG